MAPTVYPGPRPPREGVLRFVFYFPSHTGEAYPRLLEHLASVDTQRPLCVLSSCLECAMERTQRQRKRDRKRRREDERAAAGGLSRSE